MNFRMRKVINCQKWRIWFATRIEFAYRVELEFDSFLSVGLQFNFVLKLWQFCNILLGCQEGGADEGNSIVFPSCVENVCDISRIMRFGLGFKLVFCEASKLFPYCPSSALSPSLSLSLSQLLSLSVIGAVSLCIILCLSINFAFVSSVRHFNCWLGAMWHIFLALPHGKGRAEGVGVCVRVCCLVCVCAEETA